MLRTKPPRTALVVRSPRDRRYLTLMPWHGHVLVGTTDTPASPEEIDDPRVAPDDVRYLLEALSPIYPDAARRVRAAWAGIRPLVDSRARTTARLSREDQIVSPEEGVYAIAGGKLTTFRAIARRVMDVVDERFARRSGSTEVELVDPLPADGPPLAPEVPFARSQLVRGARLGMVATLDDLLTHRIGVTLVVPDAVIAHAADLAQAVGGELGWHQATIDREAAAMRDRAHEFLPPP